MTLTLAIFLDRIGVLRRTLPRVLPHVDGLVLLIDDRAHREVRDFADELGCPYTWHRWHDHYSDAMNQLLSLCPPGWVLNLDSDEDLDHPELLRDAAADAEQRGLEVMGLPRQALARPLAARAWSDDPNG